LSRVVALEPFVGLLRFFLLRFDQGGIYIEGEIFPPSAAQVTPHLPGVDPAQAVDAAVVEAPEEIPEAVGRGNRRQHEFLDARVFPQQARVIEAFAARDQSRTQAQNVVRGAVAARACP